MGPRCDVVRRIYGIETFCETTTRTTTTTSDRFRVIKFYLHNIIKEQFITRHITDKIKCLSRIFNLSFFPRLVSLSMCYARLVSESSCRKLNNGDNCFIKFAVGNLCSVSGEDKRSASWQLERWWWTFGAISGDFTTSAQHFNWLFSTMILHPGGAAPFNVQDLMRRHQ